MAINWNPKAKGTITFVNASVFGVGVYVLDENGKEKFAADLPPKQSSKQNTFAGQVWIVKDKDTDQQVETVTGKAGDQTHEINFRRGRGGPESTRGGGG